MVDDALKRHVVDKKPCSLENLVCTLRPAYNKMKPLEGRSLILCFGSTGSGKSTMLNSLLYGSESLHKTPIYEEVPTKNGKTRQVKRTVVDVKLEGQGFKIGHSRVYSQTFIPTWVEDPNFNQLWVDIAGFGDTNGDLIEYINTFIGKKIFNIAKDIKIIMPFTCGEIQD